MVLRLAFVRGPHWQIVHLQHERLSAEHAEDRQRRGVCEATYTKVKQVFTCLGRPAQLSVNQLRRDKLRTPAERAALVAVVEQLEREHLVIVKLEARNAKVVLTRESW